MSPSSIGIMDANPRSRAPPAAPTASVYGGEARLWRSTSAAAAAAAAASGTPAVARAVSHSAAAPSARSVAPAHAAGTANADAGGATLCCPHILRDMIDWHEKHGARANQIKSNRIKPKQTKPHQSTATHRCVSAIPPAFMTAASESSTRMYLCARDP